MGGDSGSNGHGFQSQHCILDEHFSHLFFVKIVMLIWKDENKWEGPFKKILLHILCNWANFSCGKWPNIGRTNASGHPELAAHN